VKGAKIMSKAPTNSIKFYPVGNGDTSLLTLSENQHILIDCKIDNDASTNKDKFDIKEDLNSLLPKNGDGRSHLDVFILTHPDNDHCAGFKDNFFCDDPANYDQNAKDRKAIIIDELWFSNTLFDRFKDPLSEAAKNFKAEAKRRKDLFKKDPEKGKLAGNRIVLIDFKDDCKDDGLDSLILEPGTSTNVFNTKTKSDFSIFVHGPFKTPTPDSQDRNETSVIMQIRFGSSADPMQALAFLAGDADYNRFKRLLDERDDESIQWDLLLSPHHCSWTFFNMTPQAEYPDPQESAIEYLKRQRGSGIVVASCKEILNNDDNPPHYQAKKEYLKEIEEDDFYSTADECLIPLVFEATKNGFVKFKTTLTDSKRTAINSVTESPKTYGSIL
jgi:hypothetical protein